jgi:hypothetical protein
MIEVSLAIACISMTITKSSLFKSFRQFVDLAFFKKLFNCPYCLSHWLSFPFIFKFGFVGVFALVTLSSIWSLFILIFLQKLEQDASFHNPKSGAL